MSWHHPFGSTARDGWDVVVEPDASGWEHTGLYAGRLADGDARTHEAGRREHVVVPLSGSVHVAVSGAAGEHEAKLAGRSSVFAGASDVAYVPAGSSLTVTAVGDARVAVVFAVTETAEARFPFRHVSADEVPVELRGAGIASREVRNFGVPGVLEADSIIACEVVTPGGNWSSWPPHKHDEERPGEETALEEIYYFEVAPSAGTPAAAATDPVGYQRVYGTEHRPIDVLAEVRAGDVVLVPHGWHGPAIAGPGYDMYYLNVMAGPGEQRAWLICDDPAHGWVRETWPDQPVDPRLPLGGTR
ncbi:5-deoxy-glucuronate isomerase [Terrabacter terrigena]|uniref:5-deoxy-glucuronate isomerase n=1 Tax=Terrabacter terrigena TaxID=574718 RepID=A0ABW3N3D8_9MICO